MSILVLNNEYDYNSECAQNSGHTHNDKYVLYNAIVYSFTHPDANTVVVESGMIVWLGDKRVAERLYPDHQWINVQDKWIAPLIVDTHCREETFLRRFNSAQISHESHYSSPFAAYYYRQHQELAACHYNASFDECSVIHTYPNKDSLPSVSSPGFSSYEDLRVLRYHRVCDAEIISDASSATLFPIICTEDDVLHMDSLVAASIKEQLPVSCVVEDPEALMSFLSSIGDILSSYSQAEVLNAPLCFHYTFPLTAQEQELLAHSRLAISISPYSITSSERKCPEIQDISRFLRAGSVLSWGFEHCYESIWKELALCTHDQSVFSPLSMRAIINAATRGGHRLIHPHDFEHYDIAVNNPAIFGIWDVDSYAQENNPDIRIKKWSLDPRSRIPMQPDLSRCVPRLYGKSFVKEDQP